jgi:cation transport ATPase
VTLLTGDAAAGRQRVARALAIDEVQAGASPQAKHDFVRLLQEGRGGGGDGRRRRQ